MRCSVASLVVVVGLCGGGLARAQAPSDRIAAYERQWVGVRTIVPLALDGRSVDRAARPAWDAFQGPDNHPIDQATFFRIVGREDLVRRSEHKLAVKSTLRVTGGVVIAAGLTWSALALLAHLEAGGPASCTNPCTSTGAWPGWIDPRLGLGVAAVGLVPYLIGRAIDPTPIDGVTQMDPGIISFPDDHTLRVSFGRDTFRARAKHRTTRSWDLRQVVAKRRPVKVTTTPPGPTDPAAP
jgi:hypothetical protein